MTEPNHVFLIGFSGSGKSTVGPRLARALKIKFYDVDTIIEKGAGKDISRIFKERGETGFRQLEAVTIAGLISSGSDRKLVALGGGALQQKKTREIVRKNGLAVYLSCSQRELYRRLKGRVDRPLLALGAACSQTAGWTLKDRIKLLLGKRRGNYDKSDIRVSTTGRRVGDVVRELRRRVLAYNAHNQSRT